MHCIVFKKLDDFESIAQTTRRSTRPTDIAIVSIPHTESKSSSRSAATHPSYINDAILYTGIFLFFSLRDFDSCLTLDMIPVPHAQPSLCTALLAITAQGSVSTHICPFSSLSQEALQIGSQWVRSIPLPPRTVVIRTVKFGQTCSCILTRFPQISFLSHIPFPVSISRNRSTLLFSDTPRRYTCSYLCRMELGLVT